MNQDITELRYALDTFYLLVNGGLVLWMAAGFAMLEGGMVRARNTTEILTKNIGLFCIACLMYFLCGYNIMYPGDTAFSAYFPGLHGLLSSADNTLDGLIGAGQDAAVYSNLADFFFQVVFVATSMSIVSGAVAERMKLYSFFLFALVMCALIYPIQGYWKWGGGFLDQVGFVDFAGSGVVHLCGATAALAGVLILGARKGKYGKDGLINAIPGANMPMVALGTLILWLGWLGFNGGSQLQVSTVSDANIVALVFVNTTLAAAAGGLLAMITAQILLKKTDLTMLCNGVLGGLVAITAAPDSPTPGLALFVGGIGGILVVFSVLAVDRLKIDDPVGAISVHGVCGIWGLIAVVFSNEEATLGAQLAGIASISFFVFIASWIVWYLIEKIIGLRVDEQVEYEGMDVHECGLNAYPEFLNKA